MASISRSPEDPARGDSQRPGVTLADFAMRYTAIRTGLVAYYRRRHAWDPEMLADEVLFRVLRQLLRNAQIRETLEQYCTGIAKHVMQEAWRRLPTDALSESWPSHDKNVLDRLDETERQILLRFCMDSIPQEEATVWKRYHDGTESRVALAAELGISDNALRIRVHRAQNAMIVIGQRVLGNKGLK
jgi:DNA-directed RNA polymerase specialized sigma24 family protein